MNIYITDTKDLKIHVATELIDLRYLNRKDWVCPLKIPFYYCKERKEGIHLEVPVWAGLVFVVV